jgi:hypothetical protein
MHIQADAAFAVVIFLIAYFFIITRKLNDMVLPMSRTRI